VIALRETKKHITIREGNVAIKVEKSKIVDMKKFMGITKIVTTDYVIIYSETSRINVFEKKTFKKVLGKLA